MIPCLVLFLTGVVGQVPPTTFHELVPGVGVHTSYNLYNDQPFPSNGLIVHTLDSVVLIDTGWGIDQTRQILHQLDGRPVAACIVTHYHADRTGGLPVLHDAGIRTMGTALTRFLAEQHEEHGPGLEIASDTTITIDGVRITILHPGAGHTRDNVVVWLPDRKVLFGGCFIKSTEAGTLGNIADADLEQWPSSVHRVKERFPDAAHVIPGHHQWGGVELLEHTLRLLKEH